TVANARAQADALQARIRPHFLFNSMNLIASLVRRDPEVAERAVLDLSDLFRAALGAGEGDSTLQAECELAEAYLSIESLRLGERLQVEWQREDGLPWTLPMPRLVLQPLVENAVRHGIGQRVGSDVIEIETRRDGDVLCIEVRNRNSSLDATPGTPAGHGIGMSNTRLRLKELYGDAADVRLDMIWPEGVACRVRLPFHMLELEDDPPEFTIGAAPA
uniref:sensor histidine kinase n=1 Tax=Pseudomonas sp. K5 TaxID=1156313 RepID=UPI001D00431D